MRKVLYGFGAAILLIVVTFGGVIGFALSMSSGLDEESKAYVEEALSAIAANWDGQKLLERSSAELRDLAKPDEVRTFFISLSRLGTMVEYQGATGQASMGYFTGTGMAITAAYVASAKFQNGAATFRIGLVKREGRWFLHSFHADPVFGPRTGSGA